MFFIADPNPQYRVTVRPIDRHQLAHADEVIAASKPDRKCDEIVSLLGLPEPFLVLMLSHWSKRRAQYDQRPVIDPLKELGQVFTCKRFQRYVLSLHGA